MKDKGEEGEGREVIKTGHWVTFNRLLIRTGLADTTGRIQVIFFFFSFVLHTAITSIYGR